MLSALVLLATAAAATLPGLPLSFDVNDEGQWVLPAELPADFADAGVQPGWVLSAIDGKPFESNRASRRQVAMGPAREVQLHFETKEGEVVVQVPREAFIHAEEVGLLPWPEGFDAPARGWHAARSGEPVVVDADGEAWALEPSSGAWQPVASVKDAPVRTIPEVWWALSDRRWVVLRGDRLQVASQQEARADFVGAARLTSFQGEPVEHLAVPEDGGLAMLSLAFPRGTGRLPTCSPDVPETCLVAGRAVVGELGGLAGARDEALRMFGVACTEGVYRACLESIALESPSMAESTLECVARDPNACHEIARERLRTRPEAIDPVSVGLLEYACVVDASGTLGERLRRLEDVGEGCVMLSEAFDRRAAPDRALLALDQACVLGRAEACDEATQRRADAFALRTVQECENPELPLASACVQLGRLLAGRPVAGTELDEFDAYLRGCELGDQDGCVLLGDFVDRWGIEHPRVVAAERTLMDACEDGEQRACIGAAHLLVRHDPKSEAYGEALVLFAAACEAGHPNGCMAGAEQRRIGQARKVEAPEPVALWSAACDQASPPGCLGLGDKLARSKKTWAEAYTAWTRACDTGEAHACTELGLLVENKHDPQWSGEQPRDAYLEQGCDNGDAEGCYWMAEDELPKKGEPPEEAYMLLEQSCEGDFGKGCAALADVHLDRKTSFDDEIAASHFQSACDNAHFESCKELGQMYLRGKGVEKDRLKAKEYLQKFSVNARRRHVRLGLHVGFPYVAGAEAELVAPIPVGPALAVAGSYSYLPRLGGALMQLKGETGPANPPDLQYADGGVRLYLNNKARGLYMMGAAHWMQAEGGDLATHDTLPPVLTRVGGSARLGIHNESKAVYTRVEMGLGTYGMVYLNDFDDDETGSFPLLQATLGFSFGFAPF